MTDPSSLSDQGGAETTTESPKRPRLIPASIGLSCSDIPLIALVVVTTGLFLQTLVHRYKFFHHLLSHHNERLLNSTRAWIDHGFWQLGGLLTFKDGPYDPAFPDSLYKSHTSFYVIPHWLALQWHGKNGFWGWVGTVPIATAFLMAIAIGVIAAILIDQTNLGEPKRPRRQAALAKLAFAAGFVITFPQETIWSLAWNNFDGSFSLIVYVVAIALLAASLRHPKLTPVALGGLYLSALLCSRFGVVVALSVLAVSLGTRRRQGPLAAVLRPRTAVICLLLGLSHYLHLGLSDALTGLPLRGGNLLYRMGWTGITHQSAQADLDYLSMLQVFTFMWRQSEEAIGKLPLSMNLEHLLFYVVGLGFFSVVLLRSWRRGAGPLLELLILPPVIWSIGLNQSASEHPDLVGLLWMPAVALGLCFAVLSLRRRLLRLGAVTALWGTVATLYLLALWQAQYLLRAYPQLL